MKYILLAAIVIVSFLIGVGLAKLRMHYKK